MNEQTKKLICLCNENFNGASCQTDIRPCSNYVCLNDGQCYFNLTSSKVGCECNNGFFGPQCEFMIDPCVKYNCSSNGYCFNNATYNKVNSTIPSAQCKCYADYTGTHCEIEAKWAKLVKYVKVSTLSIALSVLALTCLVLVGNDVWTYFINKTPVKIPLPDSKPKRFKYHTHGES
jgi:hypothetical protein